jgi:hypothetical protein
MFTDSGGLGEPTDRTERCPVSRLIDAEVQLRSLRSELGERRGRNRPGEAGLLAAGGQERDGGGHRRHVYLAAREPQRTSISLRVTQPWRKQVAIP